MYLKKMGIESVKIDIKSYINTLVLDTYKNKLVRLVGVAEEYDELFDDIDLYYKYDSPEGHYYASILIGFIPLKGVIPESDYELLVRRWNYDYNNKEKAI